MRLPQTGSTVALATTALCGVLLASTSVYAQAPSPSAAASATAAGQDGSADSGYFVRGTAALASGRYQDAIDQLEAHADRASSHPDASFNRGMAYLARVRAGAERSGDLGRAAAGFAEAALLRPDDDEAQQALELVQAEVARRRARNGGKSVLSRPSLDRVVLKLMTAFGWGVGALFASAVLTLGLVLRRRERQWGVVGRLLTPIGALGVLVFTPLYLGAQRLEDSVRAGVLVARDVHLSDDSGKRLGADPIPEAAMLEVGERRGGEVRVRYGTAEGWIAAGAVRLLRTR